MRLICVPVIFFFITASCGVYRKPSPSYLIQLEKERDYSISISENDTVFVNGIDFNSVNKNGSTIIYFENGDIAFGEFKSNCANGNWEYYDKKKRLRKSETYLGCDFCVRSVRYDKNGVGVVTISLPSF